MNKLIRRACLVSLLVIFISQMALLAHTIDHTGKDSVRCVLCICQAQQSHALPSHNLYVTDTDSHLVRPVTAQPSYSHPNETSPYYQRAPPVIA